MQFQQTLDDCDSLLLVCCDYFSLLVPGDVQLCVPVGVRLTDVGQQLTAAVQLDVHIILEL